MNSQRGERINPCLLDKLCDEDEVYEPGSSVMSLAAYKKTAERDLRNLLNTKSQLAARGFQKDREVAGTASGPQPDGVAAEIGLRLADFPEAARSVIAYGLPDLRGRHLGQLDIPELEYLIENAIRTFEPRINAHTLRVRFVPDEERPAHERGLAVLHFRMTAELWAFPRPEWLELNASFNLDTGEVDLSS